jgi:cytochrome c oxidase cbb3-type subunit 4
MIGLINGILTGLLLVVFVGIWIWAWSSKNKETFEAMAQLPLEDQPRDSGEKSHE